MNKLNVSVLILIILVLNTYDAFATYLMVKAGVIEEANPLMAYWLDTNPWVFFIVKCLLLVPLCLIVLFRNKENSVSKIGVIVLFILFTIVTMMHNYILYHYNA